VETYDGSKGKQCYLCGGKKRAFRKKTEDKPGGIGTGLFSGFALIDEAFETAGQTDGTIAVALNVNVTYVSSPQPGVRLRAEAKQASQTKKTASYDIKVTDQNGILIATCSALAYRTGKPIPFL
jgi:uncharacterized protein (TIGR00369 family)